MPSSRKPLHSSRMEKSVGSCSSARNTPGPMACGVPRAPARCRRGRPAPGAARPPARARPGRRPSLPVPQPGCRRGSQGRRRRPRAGAEHHPGFRLAVRAAQIGPAVGLVRVAVHGQPLARIEQLDQQAGIGPVGGDVFRAEEPLRLLPDGVGQHAAVGEPSPACCSPNAVVVEATQSSGPSAAAPSPRNPAISAPPW